MHQSHARGEERTLRSRHGTRAPAIVPRGEPSRKEGAAVIVLERMVLSGGWTPRWLMQTSNSELGKPAQTDGLGSGAMFNAIASRYDLLNRILSLGADRRWRREAADALDLPPGARALDVATGTADLAIEIARRDGSFRVEGLDPAEGMLEIARRKIARAGLAGRVSLRAGDAQALPHPDGSFDGVCVAFGIRNVRDRGQALREMARVTREGGRIAILELTEPGSGFMGRLAQFHVHVLVPRIGALLSGARAYRYLHESIAAFPPPERFRGMMEDAGIRVLECRPLTFGACCLFVGCPDSSADGNHA